MPDWNEIATFQITTEWSFSAPLQSNAIKFQSEILFPTLNTNQVFYNAKGLLALVYFADSNLSNPLFYPAEIIYPWIADPQIIIFPSFSLPGVYRLATKISSGNLQGNTWSLDTWEYSQSVVSPSTITSESLTAIQQLFINNPVNLSTEAIIQIAETINQQNLEYYPPG